MVYKVQEFKGTPRIKISEEPAKTAIAGAKSVLRALDGQGAPLFDVLCLRDEYDAILSAPESLSSVFDLIHSEDGPEPETMWQQIKELCERTLLAIKPSLIEHYGYNLVGKIGHHPHGAKGFQIIGLDIIFEDNCRPKLLELNANCSLSCLSPMSDPETGNVVWKPDLSGPTFCPVMRCCALA